MKKFYNSMDSFKASCLICGNLLQETDRVLCKDCYKELERKLIDYRENILKEIPVYVKKYGKTLFINKGSSFRNELIYKWYKILFNEFDFNLHKISSCYFNLNAMKILYHSKGFTFPNNERVIDIGTYRVVRTFQEEALYEIDTILQKDLSQRIIEDDDLYCHIIGG